MPKKKFTKEDRKWVVFKQGVMVPRTYVSRSCKTMELSLVSGSLKKQDFCTQVNKTFIAHLVFAFVIDGLAYFWDTQREILYSTPVYGINAVHWNPTNRYQLRITKTGTLGIVADPKAIKMIKRVAEKMKKEYNYDPKLLPD